MQTPKSNDQSRAGGNLARKNFTDALVATARVYNENNNVLERNSLTSTSANGLT